MEEEVKSPFTYLLEVMNCAKAAVEYGGKMDILTVKPLMELGFGEGEMFMRDFLTQFGTVENWDSCDDGIDDDEHKPVWFTVNERGRALGQIAIDAEQQFKDLYIPEDKMLSLAQKHSNDIREKWNSYLEDAK